MNIINLITQVPDDFHGTVDVNRPAPAAAPTVNADAPYWRAQIKALASRGALSPTSSMPMAYSLAFLIAHTRADARAPSIPASTLYASLRAWVPENVQTIPNISAADFGRHIKRWAEANALRATPQHDDPEVASHVAGIVLREKPLSREGLAAFVEGLAL